MGENLILNENNPGLLNLFLGDELYLVSESQWYSDIPSEGGNKYRFLHVFSHGGTEIIPEKNRDFFFRMISSIKTGKFQMDADGFAAVNINGITGLKWENLKKIFSPVYCIFWHADPNTLGLPCKLNGRAIDGECRIIYMPDLESIENDIALKHVLWNNIKKMFKLEKQA